LNELLKRVGGFNGAYINWGGVKKHFDMDFEWKDGEDKELRSIIRQRIRQGHPTIFKVDFNREVRGIQMHFAVAHGFDDKTSDILIVDPWTGEEYFLKAKYDKVLSLRILTPKKEENKPENKPNNALSECLRQHADLLKQLEKKDKELKLKIKELENLQKKYHSSEVVRKDLAKQSKELLAENEEIKKEAGALADKLSTANNKIAKLEEKLKTLEKEKQDYKRWYENSQEKNLDKAKPHELLAELFRRIFNKKKQYG